MKNFCVTQREIDEFGDPKNEVKAERVKLGDENVGVIWGFQRPEKDDAKMQ